MKRVFCFGCSFTGYWYPTWADILIEEARSKGIEGYNYGRAGAGNLFIALRIMEANVKYKFTPNDYVFICWSGFNREDRYVNGRGWITPGNVSHQNSYDQWFIEKYHDVRFCALRDCALISSTQLALKYIGVNSLQFSMAPLIQNNEYLLFQTFEEQEEIIKTYNIKLDFPSMMEFMGTLDRNEETTKKRPRVKFPYSTDPDPEWHPFPQEHLDYVLHYLKDKLPWTGNLSSGISLADNWTKILEEHQKTLSKSIDTLGWKQTTPNDLWQ